jgi:hypothetical protein
MQKDLSVEDHYFPLYFMLLLKLLKRQGEAINLSDIPKMFERKYGYKLELREKLAHTLRVGLFQDICSLNSTGPPSRVSPSPSLKRIVLLEYQLDSVTNAKLDDAKSQLKSANEKIIELEKSLKEFKSRPEDKFMSMLHEELICVVCLDTLNEAVESNCCKTLCCRNCSAKLASCPVCRGHEVQWNVNPAIRRLVGKIPVKCDTKSCASWSTRAEIIQHKENCEYVELKCKNKDCTFAAIRRDFKVHVDTCQYKEVECAMCHSKVLKKVVQYHETMCALREVRCTVFGCGKVVQHKGLQQHLEVCDFVALQCTNEGCNCTVQRQKMQDHLSKCAESVVKCSYCSYSFKRRSIDSHTRVCSPNYLQCPYCLEHYRKHNIALHNRNCKQTPVPCENQGCPALIVPRKMNEHLDICRWTPVTCRWEGCGGQFIRNTVAQHECSCWYRDITCTHCGFQTSRDLLDNHLRICRRRRRYSPY